QHPFALCRWLRGRGHHQFGAHRHNHSFGTGRANFRSVAYPETRRPVDTRRNDSVGSTMTSFYDLYQSHRDLPPGEQLAVVEREFPKLVAKGPLHWFSPGGATSTAPRRLVIGVATYSKEDMQLLDLVLDAVVRENVQRLTSKASQQQMGVLGGALGFVQLPPESLRVDVFSTLACKKHEDFDQFVPGLGK